MKTIRWGMIGCGAVCEVKSGPGFYKADHSALLAVASADPALTRSYASRHDVPRVYDSAEALVQDPDLDAVYVATPPSSHKALSLLAARAGKHVYVEKPMALRFDECEAIIAECRRLERRLFVAFYVIAVTFIAPKFGVGNAIFFVLVGQLISAAVIDHFALFGSLRFPVDARRFAGIALMVAGVWLARRTG